MAKEELNPNKSNLDKIKIINIQGKKLWNTRFEFTPETDNKVKDVIGSYFEVELLNGERKVLGNGNIEYLFNINSEEKANIIKKAIFALGFKNHLSEN